MSVRELLGRLTPRTLGAQVLWILLVGITVAHLASFTFFQVERAREMNRVTALEVAARVAEMASTRSPSAASLPSREGPPGPRRRFKWTEVENLGDRPAIGDPAPTHLVGEIKRLLGESLGEDPVVWASSRPAAPSDWGPGPRPRFAAAPGRRMEHDTPPPGMGAGLVARFERSIRVLTLALKLPDGRKVLVEAPHFQPRLQIPSETWLSIALVFLVTAGFSIWAVRLAVRPVKVLAAAAERLSRNLGEPPLTEKGAKELRAATRAFNRMQDRLRRHVNSRALAFAAMSHDMRTPLTRTRLRLEMLEPHVREKFAKDLDEIEALVAGALETTRSLAVDERMEPLDVNALLASIAQDSKVYGGELRIEGSAGLIEARPQALRRALGNLVENAFKYGRDVSVVVEDSRVQLSMAVCDRGPGLPEEEIPKVAAPFYRVESSRNRATGGTGLGLAIAKDIVEGHGGELEIANRERGGLRVTVKLPR